MITSEKRYDAIHLGSTSILLINIEKYVKMSQTDLSDLGNDL